jgi:hypothetical protein
MTAHQHIGDPSDGRQRAGVEFEVPELELELERAGLPRRGVLASEEALRRKVPNTRPAVASPQLAGDLPALHSPRGLAYRLPLGRTGLVRGQVAAARERKHKRCDQARHLRLPVFASPGTSWHGSRRLPPKILCNRCNGP